MKQWFTIWFDTLDEVEAFANKRRLMPGEIIIIPSSDGGIEVMYYSENE